jgi:hypothetical protein
MKTRTICQKFTIFFCILLLPAFVSCTYQDRVQPVSLPDSSPNSVNINGLKLSATAYTDQGKAKKAFGFNIREAGLLPVQLVFQNDGTDVIELVGTAGALGGGAKGYQDARKKIRQGLRDQTLKNQEIMPGQIAYGMIFFPGYDEEAQSTAWLKLTLSFSGDPEPVTLPLGP